MRKPILLSASLVALAAALFLTVNPLRSVTASSTRPSSASLSNDSSPLAANLLSSSVGPLLPLSDAASDGLWLVGQETSAPQSEGQVASSRKVSLNTAALEFILQQAPMEFTPAAKDGAVLITLPMPDGSLTRFRIQESPIMQPDLAAQLPGVKTYSGQGIDDPSASTRFDWTPLGFHAIVLSSQKAVFVEPVRSGDLTEYVTYQSQGALGESFLCGVGEKEMLDAIARGVMRKDGSSPNAVNVSNGSTLRTYRLAIATTGEWFGLYGGGSVANAQTAITSLINLVDAIYEREVAIRFTLVNNTNIIFTNSATDPYSTNAADSTSLAENQATLDNVAFLGSANYDVGHLFGGITGLGAGVTSFSGIASLGVVCAAGTKARGVSTMGNNPALVTALLFVSGVAHELAHQFNAPHTFNSVEGGCNGQRSASNAYEPGAGSTLMAYSICGVSNLQPGTGLNLHVKSLENIVAYATTSGTCATTSATGNTAPTVTGAGDHIIPMNTPFKLDATASDSNGPLTYSWEEYDLAGAATTGTYTDIANLPLFRSYTPTPVSSRTFPSLTYILNNANTPPSTYVLNGVTYLTGEVMPITDRTLQFQVVVRDNQANGGGINTASSFIAITTNAGPFQVTAPNTAVAWTGGTSQNVTWNVSNTNNLPVSTANVKITLSTDGGINFPITLNASTANDGSESITVPNGVSTTRARVRVEAVGNIFFDISDTNFTVQPGNNCPAIADVSPKVGTTGTVVTITGSGFTGVTAVSFNGTPAAAFTVNNDTNISATTPAGGSSGPITLTEAGCTSALGGYTVCPSASTTLSVDDGGINSAAGASQTHFVNRLTPASYPSTLRDVQVLFHSAGGFSTSTSVTIVAGTTTNGSPDNVFFARTLTTTPSAVDVFTTYSLPYPLTINSGDFVIGYIVNPPGVTLPRMLDTTSNANRSYRSNNQGNSYTLDTSGNYMIRGTVFNGCNGPTASNGVVTGRILDNSGNPVEGAVVRLEGTQQRKFITDANGVYRFEGVETNGFYTVTPSRMNYSFSPAERSFTQTGETTNAVFEATLSSSGLVNPLDTPEYFVRQHYLDFLGREPDEAGFNFWSDQILECGADAACSERRTINVSAAYFMSIEFAQTGVLVDGLYRASYGRWPLFAEFIPDTQSVARDVVVGQGDWMRQLTLNKEAFLAEWVQRAEFRAAYDGLTNEAYVDALISHTGVSFDAAERAALVNSLNAGTSRAEVLRQIAENEQFVSAKRNEMFVMMEYFGYLRRDPDASGFAFWLNKLNHFDGNFEQAEMVKAFIRSSEYRQRFAR